MRKSVAIAGLGAIGLPLARALDAGVEGLRLIAVSLPRSGQGTSQSGGLSRPAPSGRDPRTGRSRHRRGGCSGGGLRTYRRCRPSRPGESSFPPPSAPCCHECTWSAWRSRPAPGSWFRPARCSAWMPCAPPPRDRSTASRSRPGSRRPRWQVLLTCNKHHIDVIGADRSHAGVRGQRARRRRRLPGQSQCRRGPGAGRRGPGANAGADLGRPGATRNIHSIRVEAAAARFTMTIENVPSAGKSSNGPAVGPLGAGLSARPGLAAEGRKLRRPR